MAKTLSLCPLSVLVMALVACSEGNSGNSGSGGRSSGGKSAAGGMTTDTAGAGGNAGATGCPAPIDLGVRFVGRYDGCVANVVRFAWSGSGFVARFDGTGLGVQLRGPTNYFTVLVDGALQPTLITVNNADQTYPLAIGLAAGEHVVELYRRTEASSGATSVVAVTVESGQLLAPPAAPARLIEVVGDSISCGYGNEGTAPCGFTQDTENHYLSYGALLARSLGAELSTVAWSGKGVVVNFGGGGNELIPLVYERVVPTEKRSLWNFVPQAQLVVVNLGTNDFSANTDPTEAAFVAGYTALLANVRSKYPAAYILCTNGPMLSGTDLTAKARPYIAEAVAARRAAGDLNVEAYEMTTPNPTPGCDSHPSLLTHQAMATELEAKVRPVLGW
jgi:lysophospholipase L1-like esterase